MCRCKIKGHKEHWRTEMVLVQQKAAIVCQCLSHCLHRDSLCAGRYTPDWDSRRWAQGGIQRYMSDSFLEWGSAASQALWKASHTPKMEGTALWKLKRRLDLSVNTQHRGVVGERPWTDELLPNAGCVRPWNIQQLPVPHEASGNPRMNQLW